MKKKIRLTETQLIEYIQKTVSKVLTEQSDRKVYQYPNDSNWIYSVENGKWHAARTNREVPKWININDNPAYKVSIERLDKIHPTARAHEQVSGIPLKNSPSHAEENPRYDPRADGYELPTPGFKDPNRHIERKKALNRLDRNTNAGETELR